MRSSPRAVTPPPFPTAETAGKICLDLKCFLRNDFLGDTGNKEVRICGLPRLSGQNFRAEDLKPYSLFLLDSGDGSPERLDIPDSRIDSSHHPKIQSELTWLGQTDFSAIPCERPLFSRMRPPNKTLNDGPLRKFLQSARSSFPGSFGHTPPLLLLAEGQLLSFSKRGGQIFA